MGINVSVVVPAIIITKIWKPDTTDMKYDPRLLREFGREKLDEVYGTLTEEILKSGITPDLAVKRYIRGIKKNQLYVFDNQAYYQLLAMKGNEPQQYENFLVEMQENRAKNMRDHFHKHGINIEDYM